MSTKVEIPVARDELKELMAGTYLPDARSPYHGISHPDVVKESARELVTRLRLHGVQVDEKPLDIGLSLHDSLQHIKPELLGFRVPEELAAKMAYQFAKDQGLSELRARRAERVALATSPHYRPISPEEIVARVSDLGNLPSEYERFRAATQGLYQEARQKSAQPVSFEEWLPRGFQYLSHFLWPMLELTPAAYDKDGRSDWHTRSLGNIMRTWRETYQDARPVVVEIVGTGQTARRWNTLEKSMWIGVQAIERDREHFVAAIGSTIKPGEVQFVVPGSAHLIPLPDKSVDEVVLQDSSPEALAEAMRVLRDGGLLHSTTRVSHRALEDADRLESTFFLRGNLDESSRKAA